MIFLRAETLVILDTKNFEIWVGDLIMTFSASKSVDFRKF